MASVLVLLPVVSSVAQSKEQANTELIRKFYEEAWNKGNTAFADEVFAYPYLRHDSSDEINNEPDTTSQAEIARFVRSMYTDFSIKPHLLIAKDDLVTARWTMKGNPTGFVKLLSLGQSVSVAGVNIFRIRDGKVVEIFNSRDDYTLAQQIGLIRLEMLKGIVIGALLIGTLWYINSRRLKNKTKRETIVTARAA